MVRGSSKLTSVWRRSTSRSRASSFVYWALRFAVRSTAKRGLHARCHPHSSLSPEGRVMNSRLNRRHFLRLGFLGTIGLASRWVLPSAIAAEEGELLYNGIRLPTPWPLALKEIPEEPVTPAYLRQ